MGQGSDVGHLEQGLPAKLACLKQGILHHLPHDIFRALKAREVIARAVDLCGAGQDATDRLAKQRPSLGQHTWRLGVNLVARLPKAVDDVLIPLGQAGILLDGFPENAVILVVDPVPEKALWIGFVVFCGKLIAHLKEV